MAKPKYISADDVLRVAKELHRPKLTKTEIEQILQEHDGACEQDPTGTWNLVVEHQIDEVIDNRESAKLNKPFNITSVCRADLAEKIGKERALAFSDDEMKELASNMANAYCETDAFWIEMEDCAEYIEENRT